MKHVLLISYGWVPKGSVGMLRMVKFAKYLIKFGYKVSVITNGDAGGGTVYWDLEEPLLDSVKLYKVKSLNDISMADRIKARIHPQLEIDWLRAVDRELGTLLKDIQCDCVLSSSPPESAHIIASEIKERSNIPWIADLRDLWAHDHYRDLGVLRRALVMRTEKSVLRKADVIVTVSDIWAEFLTKNYGPKVRVIPNGYDEEYFERIPEERPGKFSIAYLGKLNGSHQSILSLLSALRDIVRSGRIPKDKMAVDFYVSGYGKPDIGNIVREYGLEDMIKEHDPVPLSRALSIMKNSSVLLLVGWRGRSSAGWRPQKVYEYLGSGTPILLINGSDNTELAGIVRSTGSGSVADSPELIEEKIVHYYAEFISSGAIRSGRLRQYAASSTTKKLCEIIESIKAN